MGMGVDTTAANSDGSSGGSGQRFTYVYRRAHRALPHLARVLPWVPLVPAAIWVVALLTSFKSLVDSLYLSSDSVAGEVIASLMSRRPPGGTVVLGNIPYYSEIWFERLTRGLPDHRQLWEITPWLFSLVAIALLAWATARVAGRWAAMIVAVSCACAGPILINDQFGWSIHSQAYATVCVIGAALVPITFTAVREGGRRWWWPPILALLAVILGLGMAGDTIAIIGGTVPFVVAAAVVGWQLPTAARRRLAVDVGMVTLGAVLVRLGATAIAHHQHLQPGAFAIVFAAYNQLLDHVGDLVGSLVLEGNGASGGVGISLTSGLALLAAIAVAAGWLATLQLLHRNVRGLLVTGPVGRSRGAPADAEPRPLDATAVARSGLLAFWLVSGLLVSFAFVCTNVPVGTQTSRYIVTVFYGLVVVLAIVTVQMPRRWPRRLLCLGVTIVVAGSALAQVQRQNESGDAIEPTSNLAGEVLHYAQQNGLATGYAGYWDAYPLTWQTHQAMQVYPVTPCGPSLCPTAEMNIPSWYVPRAGIRTFLVIDSDLSVVDGGMSAPPPAFGKPTRTATFGQLTVYVYPYDIASKFGS